MSFSDFLVILGDIDLNNIFKKSKTSCTVFFSWRLSKYNVEKQIQNSEGHR